jgi:hypothetical protein
VSYALSKNVPYTCGKVFVIYLQSGVTTCVNSRVIGAERDSLDYLVGSYWYNRERLSVTASLICGKVLETCIVDGRASIFCITLEWERPVGAMQNGDNNRKKLYPSTRRPSE